MFDFFDDRDNVDVYPSNGDLEEKAIYLLNQMRQQFYMHRKNYIGAIEGGLYHHMVLMSRGPKSAENTATMATNSFKAFIQQAYLTEEGETTDPRYPIDNMVNHELRRIRRAIFHHVSFFWMSLESMMPDNMTDWDPTITSYNIMPYLNRYSAELYDDINTVIPNRKMKPPSTADVGEFITNEILIQLWDTPRRERKYPGKSREAVLHATRDELIHFILKEIPFNNVKLEEKTPLLVDEIMDSVPETKPVMH